ncbi:YbaK/EbsC family protein [Candidatus Nanosalina sp. VS9-1]|uniref:YbaK/EbsC family protein n=1 Tax=Candidatus Nanosalina sp. VS9-1 TaxID=3388566 RepID=UPI0039DFC075
MSRKADEKLEEFGISFEEVIQDNPTKSCDDAARERGLETSQIVKSLIIEAEGQKFHVLLPGDRTLSEKKFGSEYRMIPPEKSKEITGFESGTVHPFSTELKHFVDERIFENEKVSHTVGETQRAVILKAESFREVLEKSDFIFEVGDFAVSTEQDFQEVMDRGLDEESAKFVVNKGVRSIFLDLSREYNQERVLDLLKAFNRESLDPEYESAAEILDRAESQTHMQRLVEALSENGELPEASSFDLEEKISEVLEENPDAVEDFQEGRDSALNYLIGQLMQETNGKADAGEAREKFMEELR